MVNGTRLAWLVAVLFVGVQPRPAARIDSLEWLAGCWTMTSSSGVVEEHWMRPSGGTMLGMGRTVRGGKTAEFEFLQIREDSGRLLYDARSSGQAAATFPLLTLTDQEIVFEDRAHDFPQRIIYRRNADGGVTARIEGARNGQIRGVDFPYQRCPSRPTR
jgi:hypothetical protein